MVDSFADALESRRALWVFGAVLVVTFAIHLSTPWYSVVFQDEVQILDYGRVLRNQEADLE
jgi:hypothetical protein